MDENGQLFFLVWMVPFSRKGAKIAYLPLIKNKTNCCSLANPEEFLIFIMITAVARQRTINRGEYVLLITVFECLHFGHSTVTPPLFLVAIFCRFTETFCVYETDSTWHPWSQG